VEGEPKITLHLKKGNMRARKEVENDPKSYDQLYFEILLDIRDLLKPKEEPKRKKKRGRPKRTSSAKS